MIRCSTADGGCGRTLDPASPDTYWMKVTGWERKRNQGGTNHVSLRKQLDVFMCNGCMKLQQAGIDTRQTSLV